MAQATKLAMRKHATFFTLGLPQLDSGPAAIAQEAVSLIHEALSILWTADPRLVLYIFPTKVKQSKSPPYTSLPSLDDASFNRNHLESYTHQMWLRKGKRAWIRFFIGHDLPADSLISSADPKMGSRHFLFKRDAIQAPSTTTCGFLVGTHKSFDLKHYTALLNSVPSLANHPVALSNKVLKTHYKEEVPRGKEVFAVHISCDASKRTATNILLKALYNRRSAKDLDQLPDGKLFKYVPYQANSGDLVPGARRKIILRTLRIKQQQFQARHDTVDIKGVLDLDLPFEFGAAGKLTLRQILLSTKCQDNCNHPLILSVDYNAYRDATTALYHKGNQEEVHDLMSALPVVLAAQFGPRIWTWFCPDLKTELSHFIWNPETQCLEEAFDDDDLLANIYGDDAQADWEQVDPLNVPAESATSMKMDLSLLFHAGKPLSDPADDNLSMVSLKTNTSNATQAAATAPPDFLEVDTEQSTDDSSLTDPFKTGSSSQRAGVSDNNG